MDFFSPHLIDCLAQQLFLLIMFAIAAGSGNAEVPGK